jgi:hypothetical protein
MKLPAYFLLQGRHQKSDNKSYFARSKILEILIFLEPLTKRRYLLLKFLHHFVYNKGCDEPNCGSKRLYKMKPILDHLNAKLMSEYTPDHDVQWMSLYVQGTFIMEDIYIP